MDVLVLDGLSRKSLPVVRSLGEKRIDVTVGEAVRFHTSGLSRYCKRTIVYPSPKESEKKFVNFLFDELKRKRYSCIIPVADETVLAVVKHKDELKDLTAVPFPDSSVFLKAADKEKTLKIAIEFDIPCPKTTFVSDLTELEELKDSLKYPVVIKPKDSYGSRGLRYIKRREELIDEYKRVHRVYKYPLVQEYIPPGGDAYGVSVLLDKSSEVKALFVHRRLREYPVTGGPSTLRVSMLKPEIANLGIRMLKALGWYGVAMVEFKVDPRDNTPKLMEVNPRFWGSLPLAILAGVDFPYLLYQVALEGDVEPVLKYQSEVKCRWLLPGDLLNFLSNLKRGKLETGFFSSFGNGTGYDILSSRDAMPVLGVFLETFRTILDKERWRYVFKR